MIIIDSAWKKRLRPAEFRGVPFFIDSHEISGGRHAVPHEAPDRNAKGFTEDIGLKTDSFTIEGHILGDSYFLVRDSLIAALKKKGSGTLKHPYLGIKDVQVDSYRFKEDTQQGRFASFQVTFLETGNLIFPEAIFNAVADFFNEANEAIDNVQTVFEGVWSLTNLPGYALEQAINTVSTVGSNIDDAVDAVNTFPDKLTELKKLTLKLKDVTLDLLSSPSDLADLTMGTIEAMALTAKFTKLAETDTIDTSSGKDDQISVYDSLLGYGADAMYLDGTPTEAKASANDKAFNDMVNQMTVLSVAKISVAKQFASKDEALAQQQKVMEFMDGILADTSSDVIYNSFKKVAAFFVEALPAQTLANLVTIKNDQMTTSILSAYDLYESLDREADIIARNGIRNPAFISAGELEVLSGG